MRTQRAALAALGLILGSSVYAQHPTSQALSPSSPQSSLPAFLKTLGEEWKQIGPRISRNSMIFQRMATRAWVVEFKTLGTSDTVSLTRGDWFLGLPRVSQDGSTFFIIAAPPQGGDSRHILALTPGRAPKVLAQVPLATGFYDVSPDGSRIAYQVRTGTPLRYQIFLKDLASGENRQFTDPNIGGLFPSFSPDGGTIAYFSGRKLRLRSVATGEERILADDGLLKELPTWSPDGKTIAYQATAGDPFHYDIYRLDVESDAITRLTRSKGLDVNPVFTADGQSIIFTSERETSSNSPTVFLMNRDGSNLRRDVTAGDPVYLPSISLSAVVVNAPGLVPAQSVTPAVEEPAPTPEVRMAASPTPAVQPPVAFALSPESSKVSYTLDDLIASLEERQADIDRMLDGNSVFYQVRTTTGVLLQAKRPGSDEAVTLARLPHSSLARPDVRTDRRALFFKFIDQSGRASHIVQLEAGRPARSLAALPLVPELAFENFDLSDDGSRIFFDLQIDELTTIYRYDVNSGAAQAVLPGDEGGVYPALSPDGRILAYVAGGQLRLLDLESSAATTLVDDLMTKQHPAWSADGSRLYYQASDGGGSGLDVYVTERMPGEPRRLTTSAGDDATPAPAPGGTILFTSDRESTGFPTLYTMSPDGSEQARVPGAPGDALLAR